MHEQRRVREKMRNDLDGQRAEQAARLKYALEVIGRTQAEVANELGLDVRYINPIILGQKRVNPVFARLLESRYNISAVWLLEGTGGMLKPPTLDSIQGTNADFADLPLLDEPVAGEPRTTGKWEGTKFPVLLSHLVPTKPNSRFYVLRKHDDDMAPEVQDGDVLLIEGNDFALKDGAGRLCVLQNPHEVVLRRLELSHPGVPDRYSITSPNPSVRSRLVRKGTKVTGLVCGIIWRSMNADEKEK